MFNTADSVLQDVYDPQFLNRYAYTRNNPIKYTDPSGHIIDTIIDAGFILYDVGSMVYHAVKGDWQAVGTDAKALAADVACAAAPVATGGGLMVRGAEHVAAHGVVAHGDDAVRMGKEVAGQISKKADNAVSVGEKTKAVANGKITGHTEHGLNQSISRDGGRGVSAEAKLDAVKNPTKVVEQSGGRTKYVGKDATVVTNKDGKVITTYGKPRGSGARGVNENMNSAFEKRFESTKIKPE